MGVDKGKICGKIKVGKHESPGRPDCKGDPGGRALHNITCTDEHLTTVDFYGIMKDFDHRVTLCANGVPKEI
jgi:hypothetical protein